MAAAAARRVVQLVSRSQMRHSYFRSASSNADILITGIEFRVHPAAASLLHPPVDKRYGSELSSIWKNAALRLDTRNISQLVTSNEEGDFLDDTLASVEGGSSRVIDPTHGVASRIKFKRLSKTAKHIMQILDVEAVQEVKAQREIPNIKPGYIVQLKVEVPENKRRVSILKGIVIARRNAGLNTTLRIRRLVAGIGVESVFPLYSPNIKEIKVLDQKKVRRAKLYYLRDRMASADRK